VTSQAAAAPARLDSALERVRRWWSIATAVRPAYVLATLVGVQWLAVLILALTVRHNGWLYYAGGDQLWHYTGAYLLAHGHLPPSYVGYGWSLMLLPFAAIAGPNLVSALPAIVLLNTLVLLPVALLCVYGIAARIAGRMFGYWAAALWVALPYLGVLFVEPGYHQKYTELTLPQLEGLSSVPDFPSTVGLLVCAYFALRAAEAVSGWQSGVAAGLAAGYSIAIKPSNAIFLVAPALLLLATRRRRLLTFAVGLAPALLTLALWKFRGLGALAAAPAEPIRLASGVGGLLDRIHAPSLNSWAHLHQVLLALREHFWIARVLEWVPIAGMLALLVRARRGFLLAGGWFAVYVLLKATYIPASVEDASFWRILMPAFPAFVLLAAAVVLALPGLRPRPVAAGPPRNFTRALVAAAVLFAVLPFAAVAAMPRLHDQGKLAVHFENTLILVTSAVHLRADASAGTVHLAWRNHTPGTADGFYRVMRGATYAPPGGVSCAGRRNNASDNCSLYVDSIGTTNGTSFVDRPGSGTWTYRIGTAANWIDDPTLGDVYVVSPPVSVSVP
jgi:hypothetical protein